MNKEINIALENAKQFLLKNQNEEGYWSIITSTESKGPEHLQKPIVLTSQAIESLIYLQPEDTSQITKGIFYCFKEKLEDTDNIDLLAFKLRALSYSNVPFIQKKAKQILKTILERQNKEGFWPSFPKSSNLTNYLVVDSIVNYPNKESLKKISSWLINHKALDASGWGINETSEKSQVSFTANVALTLLNCNEESSNKEILNSVKFLESKQMKDGGWPSSDLTYPSESTTYATALTTLVLIKTKEDINNKIIENGIKFLIDSQLPDGSWPLKKGGSPGEYFTTLDVIKTLSYYNYLKEKLSDESIKEVLDNSKDKNKVINYLLREYETNIRNYFLNSTCNNIIEKILATTPSAIKRRKIILNLLENEGEKDTADIIDGLKRLEGYKGLHKRSHLA